ncbi:MAG: YcgN family cysteine cluster protein, partial [Roseovarius sp.]|uniref:YcgN family cysteine cluster protein n=1 Tax=Roseovarius sp. TaxID=1486281 RepID=UPI0032EDAFF3
MTDDPIDRTGLRPRFWETTPLNRMTRAEWEALCDGCGKCCLNKLEDDDTGAIHHTDVACRLLDLETCRCRDYANRKAEVPDCQVLTPVGVPGFRWLPSTCAY